METLLVIANLGCLGGACWGAWRLWRTPAAGGGQPSFGALLADIQLVPRPAPAASPPDPDPSGERSAPSATAPTTLPQSIDTLGVADRLAIVRNMLQGRSAAETASMLAVPPAQVQALYRLHGRHGG
jgi:DNA-directed RNA polymerase specialized sigma24 family protein